MAENNEETKLYEDIAKAVEAQNNGQEVSADEKARLITELANRANDFDPDQLENIIALTAGVNTDEAEKVRNKVNAQKAQTEEAQPQDNSAENPHEQAPAANTASDEETRADNAEIPLASQVSYEVLKNYENLKAQENPSEEDKAKIAKIEQDTNTILDNIDFEDLTPETAVIIRDYLDISNAAENHEANQQRNDKIAQIIEPKLAEFDRDNHLENLPDIGYEALMENTHKWTNIANANIDNVKEKFEQLDGILEGATPDEKKSIHITLLQLNLTEKKMLPPTGDPQHDSEIYLAGLEDTLVRYEKQVQIEYLKRVAGEEFNNNPENQNAENDEQLRKKREEYIAQRIQSALDGTFKGPYTNPEYLAEARNTVQGLMVSRTANLDSRMARLTKAPHASPQVVKMNNQFAENNPKLYAALRSTAIVGRNLLLSGAKTAAIGFVLGPVGLTAYSAGKTLNAILKSKKNFEEQTGQTRIKLSVKTCTNPEAWKAWGNSWKNYWKYIRQPENRKEMLTLAGQVAATAISAYFVGSDLIENGANLGLFGKLTGINNTTTQALTDITHAGHENILQAGWHQIINSPRRLALMAASAGTGVAKGVSSFINKRNARNDLKKLLKEAGIDVDKKTLRALEKIPNPNAFAIALQELAPNLSTETATKAFELCKEINKNSPVADASGAVIGALVGVAAAGIAQEVNSLDDLKSHFTGNDAHDGGTHGGVNGSWDINKSFEENMQDNSWHPQDMTSEAEHDVQVPYSPDHSPSDVQDEIAQAAEQLHAKADDLFNAGDAAGRRFESFGIDAKNANEMLRDMGVIDKNDHHFYRQSELAKLVTEKPLTDEQKIQIQEWANDRDARVHNLQTWQKEHPVIHRGNGGNSGGASEGQTQQSGGNTTTPQPEQEQEKTVEQHAYTVRGKIDKLKISKDNPMTIQGANKEEAVASLLNQQGLQNKTKLVITDEENGTTTKFKYDIDKHKDHSSSKVYDSDGKKISYTKTTIEKDNDGNETSRKIYSKRDLDGDGKRDKIHTTIHKDADGRTVEEYKKVDVNGDGKKDKIYTTTHIDAEGNKTEVSLTKLGGKGGDTIFKKTVNDTTVTQVSANEQAQQLGIKTKDAVKLAEQNYKKGLDSR